MSSAYLDDKFFMKWADDVSKASTCAKIQVGAVLVKGRRVLSIGYNGAAPGMPHCTDHFTGDRSREVLGEEEFLKQHRQFSETSELHAESNLLVSAWLNHVEVQGSTVYTQYSPCFGCSKLIIQAKIARVVYSKVYDEQAIEYLRSAGIQVDCL